ncbi:hypothetical protein JDV02_009114 [Purpureocillium takamizusanense]|uniref:Uncharacterized protein n=1 Tax=Purpureocillium takamizusanense TaxID=2060973 RepID=A0A9Q8VDX8_9HYPO|nr:uncharacterized protein JDV02_009114 [Purpureocillium takamizusanense]UNI23285.1 hypothetical protein JDV02_009114 [Purpureocillium takamizusanense]
MKAAAILVALVAAVSASPARSKKGDEDPCVAIKAGCTKEETECQDRWAFIECPPYVERFCPCYNKAKYCIKKAGCKQ